MPYYFSVRFCNRCDFQEPMADKDLRIRSDKQAIDQFINEVRSLPKQGGGQGRLIFALDATASREATWDQACHLQSELFMATRDLGGLSIQLCYYRGFGEFKATGFVTETGQLLNLRTPVFMFHEGSDAHARAVFQQVSKLSGGAYAPFDRSSPQVLKDLMAAVAVYASGGAKALQDFSSRSSPEVKRLTKQIR